MASPQNLHEILSNVEDERDSQWENQFFNLLSMSNVDLFQQEPKTGPDGWPYLLAQSGEKSQEPFQRILHWLHDRGIGLVLNPQKEYPDYVFTYGMIWHFKETGMFFKEAPKGIEGVFEFKSSDIKSAGEPTEAFLPKYVRTILKEFFAQQGVLQPKFLAITLDGNNFELAFSLESLGNPVANEHQGILEAISWFLPPHYKILLLSENELPIRFVIL